MENSYRPCVGGVIMNKEKNIFLGLRKDYQNAWQMPQGGIDEGETPEEALHRELLEEIGTNDITILKKTSDWHYYDFPEDVQKKMANIWGKNKKGQKQIWFLCKMNEEALINIHTVEPEFINYRWASAQEALVHCIEFKKNVYQAVFQELGMI